MYFDNKTTPNGLSTTFASSRLRLDKTLPVSQVSLLSFSPLFFSPLLKMNAILRKFLSWTEPSLPYPAVR